MTWFLKWLLFHVRFKSLIASEKQVYDKGENTSFIQILISFYIQSEVVPLSAFSLLLSVNLKNKLKCCFKVTELNSKGT